MDEAYASTYADLYRRHWWWRAREEYLVRTLRRLQPAGGWGRILDVGCGDALFFDRLRDFGYVEGVEPNAAMVDPCGPWAPRIHLGPFSRAFDPGTIYGLVLMLDVLEHLADPMEALEKGAEVLASNGHLVLTVPAFQSLWTAHDEVNGHVSRFTSAQVSRLVERAGFRIIESRYFFHWLYPLKLLVRLKEHALGTKPRAEHVPPTVLNALLYRLCLFEQAALRRFSLPFGTSVLVVATKGGR